VEAEMRVIRIGFVFALVFFAFYGPAPAVTELDPTSPMTPGEQTLARTLVREGTVRVVARTCDGAIRGSGFGANGLLFTNKHLTTESEEIKVDQLGTPVLRVVQARSADHDIAVTDSVGVRELVLAAESPVAGEPLVLAGHAGGGELRIVEGSAQAEVDGEAYGISGRVLLIKAKTMGGFSGGPVLNRQGEVVAMLQGFDYSTGLTLAIPAKTLLEWGNSASNIGAGVCG
jgi:S1-C subfamily serine protease